jgi:hypothetical protein
MSGKGNARLDSWKEIADFLRVDIRTVHRWEKERALPVHRIPGGGRPAVHAYVREIEDWLRSDKQLRSDSNSPRQTLDATSSGAGGSPPLADNGVAGAVGANGSRPASTATSWALRYSAIVLVALVLVTVFGLRFGSIRINKVFAQLLTGFGTQNALTTVIDSVSPIYAEATQTVVIRGHGFGSKPRTIRVDAATGGVDTLADTNQTSLVVANLGEASHRWTAGRASEVNSCDIGVRLDEWSDSQIVISGFSGPLGSGCGEKYQIAAGDRLEIGVFGPRNQCGPGGLDNCPEEIRNGHIGLIQIQALPPVTRDHPCR